MDFVPLLFLLAVAGAFWMLVIRPARNRQQQQLAVVRALEPGTKVLLASGMVGTVVAVADDDMQVEIAPGVVATFVKQAVLRTVDDAPADGSDRPVADAGGDGPHGDTTEPHDDRDPAAGST